MVSPSQIQTALNKRGTNMRALLTFTPAVCSYEQEMGQLAAGGVSLHAELFSLAAQLDRVLARPGGSILLALRYALMYECITIFIMLYSRDALRYHLDKRIASFTMLYSHDALRYRLDEDIT